ncbi:hypothetical protein Hanom_Chr06g00525541 [Helianthus anomalus]
MVKDETEKAMMIMIYVYPSILISHGVNFDPYLGGATRMVCQRNNKGFLVFLFALSVQPLL